MPAAFAIFFILLSAIAIFAGVYHIMRSAKLKRKGLVAQGTITGYVPDTMNNKTTYYPAVRFITQNNEWITEKNMISGYYLPGKRVTVYYNPHNPKEFVIDTLQNTILPFVILVIGIVILIAAIILLTTGHLFSFT